MDPEKLRYALVDLSNSLPGHANSPCTSKTPINEDDDHALQNSKSGTVQHNNNDTADLEQLLIKSIVEDDKSELVSTSTRLFDQSKGSTADRTVVSRLLHLCCSFDSVDCATSLVNGELGAVPLLNEPDLSGMSPMHVAAASQAARCVELLLKKRARTDLKTRNGRGLLPLELSLSSNRIDVIWNPHDHSIEDLLVQLSEKDLTVVKLISENTKEIDKVAYSSAIEGRVVDLATLLIVAAEKVNKSILALHDTDFDFKERTTIYECVIKEVLALGRSRTPPRAAKQYSAPSESESFEKRKLLLCEIELLQLFGAVAQTGCTDRKLVSPLIRACQAGDEIVIELLLKTNIDINDVDADGNSALHWCLKTYKGSCPQQMMIMWLLLKHGARVNQKNKLGLTVVHFAAANGNSQALQVLLLEDPDCINSKTEMKETPLFFAVKNDCKDCAELLLRWGASTEVLNLRRQRPIDLAESQDMRFMLNNTTITNRVFPFEQKYTTCLKGDEAISETCEETLTLADEGSSTDRTCLNTKTEVCKYFESPGGCFRGTKCLFAHGEEEVRPKKQGRVMIHSHAAWDLERKIFVGGLPPSLDSDSLGNFFEEQFGSVDNAIVIGVQMRDKINSRGFGFITFKHKKSVSAAVEAHYVTIMGKQVEIKDAVPKCLLPAEFQKSPQQYEQDQSDQQLPQAQTPSEKTKKEITSWQMPSEKTKIDILSWQTPGKKIEKEPSSCKTTGESKSESRSWIDTLIHGQQKASSNESQADIKRIPAWLRIFNKWLPRFLQRVSKMGGEYALSSLKADFRAAFGLELDHASLGFSKLSDFMRSFSHLCHIKYVPTGQQKTANHMILLPILPVPHQETLQLVRMQSPSSHSTSIDDSGDGDSTDARNFQDFLLMSSENKNLIESSTRGSHGIPDENSEDTLPEVYLRFLQFLNPDPIFHDRPWIYSEYDQGRGGAIDEREWLEGFKGMNPRTQGRHLVLEALARKKNTLSVFFLREFDFHDNYKANIMQGKCFGCNQFPVLWANFPCLHLLWCADCKRQAMQAASYSEHKCVVCDIKVQKIDVISWHEYSQPIHNIAYIDEFPPFNPAYIRNLSKMKMKSP